MPESVAGGRSSPGPLTVRLAVLAPAEVGLKRTVMAQLAPAARVEQPLEATAKSPASVPSIRAESGPMMVPPVLETVNGALTGYIICWVSPGAGMATAGKKS